jgi:hypothetical protein
MDNRHLTSWFCAVELDPKFIDTRVYPISGCIVRTLGQ